MRDRGLAERAAVRVLNARTVSAKVNGELAERIDWRVRERLAEDPSFSVAALIRSALRLYFLSLDQDQLDDDVIEGTARQPEDLS